MRTIVSTLLAIALLMITGSEAASDERSDRATDGPVSVRLISDLADPDDATPGRVGVLLTMEPGWHVYWQNPGDSGLPTEVRWNTPDSLQVGDVQWPTPERFSDPAGHESFGYSDEVVLHNRIETSSAASAIGAVTAEVSWLACKEKCVLGGATVELSLPIGAATADENRELLNRWEARLPRTVTADELPFVTTVRQLDSDTPNELAVQAFLKWNETPAAGTIEWFPVAPADTEIRSARARTRAGLTRVDIDLRLEPNSERPESLPSVLVYGNEPNRSSLALQIPLQP